MHQIQEDLIAEILQQTEGGRGPLLTRYEEGDLIFYLKTEARSFVGRFLYEMLNQWFFGGKRVPMPFFLLTEVKGQCLAKVVLKTGGVFDHLDLFRREIELGLRSSYHATKILEMKGLSTREKTTVIQEKLTGYLYRFPEQFDYDLLNLMQRVFSSLPESFVAPRSSHSLARFLTIFYAQSRQINKCVEKRPHERHLRVKCFEVVVELPFSRKKGLGVAVSLNYVREHEVCGPRHLEEAIKAISRDIEIIEGSQVEERLEGMQSIYLEVAQGFNRKSLLEKELPPQVMQRIERLQKPLFAPRNEEEVLRNLIVLSKQIKYVKDYPQVMISFDQQVDKELVFFVLISRVINKKTKSIHLLTNASGFVLDRVKTMGMVRKKYPKEGAILRLLLPIDPFVRADQSVDLVRARSYVLGELEQILGEVRDFNGGMIAKSNEAYSRVLDILGSHATKHSLLIENIFHSTTPAFMRAVVPPQVFQTLLLMILKPREQEMTYLIQEGYLYVLIYDSLKWKVVHEAVKELNLGSAELLTLNLPEVLGFVSPMCDRQLLKAVQSLIIKPC